MHRCHCGYKTTVQWFTGSEKSFNSSWVEAGIAQYYNYKLSVLEHTLSTFILCFTDDD